MNRLKNFTNGARLPLLMLRAVAVGLVWGLVSIDCFHIAIVVVFALVIGHVHAVLVESVRDSSGWDR